MTIKEERRAHRAKAVTPEFIMGDVHEDVFKSVFARSVHTYSSMATRSRPFPPVTTYRLDQMSGFGEVNPKSIGNILRGLYDWGFLTPHVRANKTHASITPKGWAYLFFYLNRADFGLGIFTPFAEAAIIGPYTFAEFVKETGLPDVWFYDLCKAVWEHEESFVPEERRRPWPWSAEGGSVPFEAGVFMPCLGIEEHPIDAIIETRSPRMSDEEVQALYLERSKDSNQVMQASLSLARDYGHDIRFDETPRLRIEGFIAEHLSPVEIIQFEHERMRKGPGQGLGTLVERMSEAKQFRATTLADMAPNRLGISDMDASGHGVSKIAAALRLDEEAAAARNLGTDGQTTLGEAGISLTPPEPTGEETRARLIETLKRIDDGVYDCLADQADAILAALSPEALDVDFEAWLNERDLLPRGQWSWPSIVTMLNHHEEMMLHNKRGYTREHERVGEIERTVTVVGPIWTDANEVPGSTWYSGHKLHIVRGGGSDKKALTLAGQPLVVDFIIDSDYDEQHVAYLEREVDHLMDKMNLPHDVQYYRQIDEDMKLLHNKRGYTREHQRVGEVEHTLTTVGPVWTDAIVTGLIGLAIGLSVMGFGIWSGLLVIAP